MTSSSTLPPVHFDLDTIVTGLIFTPYGKATQRLAYKLIIR
ncbi:hypothetical protein [Pseudomonas sp. BP8]|nr:hypothetical protein [Pseudomonas sp. BP8]MBP2259936.1 hypothetical protein [Pseudomonas sp. BP8]